MIGEILVQARAVRHRDGQQQPVQAREQQRLAGRRLPAEFDEEGLDVLPGRKSHERGYPMRRLFAEDGGRNGVVMGLDEPGHQHG